MTTTTEQPGVALEVLDRRAGELIDVRAAETERLAEFIDTLDEIRGELADDDALVRAELLRRLDRRAEWTMRVGDPKTVQWEIKAPSPTAGTTAYDVDILREELLRALDDDRIDEDLANAALERTITIVAKVPVTADLDDLETTLQGLEAIAGTPVHDVKVAPAEKATAAGVARLGKAGHQAIVDAAKIARSAPARRATVTRKTRER